MRRVFKKRGEKKVAEVIEDGDRFRVDIYDYSLFEEDEDIELSEVFFKNEDLAYDYLEKECYYEEKEFPYILIFSMGLGRNVVKNVEKVIKCPMCFEKFKDDMNYRCCVKRDRRWKPLCDRCTYRIIFGDKRGEVVRE